MMAKIGRRKFKGQNGLRYKAVNSVWLAGMNSKVGYGVRAVVMQYLLCAIVLLSFIPGLSSAAVLPTIQTLTPIIDRLALPDGIAVGADGKVYVAESNNDLVHLFNQAGEHQGFIAGLEGPTAVAVDAAGQIYIGNARTSRSGRGRRSGSGSGNVQVYNANLELIGTLGAGNGEFKTPVGIAVSSAGLIYVVDGGLHQVKVYNADFSFRSSFGGMGPADGQFQAPTSIAINETTSEILIPDWTVESGSARVQVFGLNGEFLRSFITEGADDAGDAIYFKQPSGIAVDAHDRVYVTDSYQSDVVMVYDVQGNYLGRLFDDNLLLRNSQDIAFAPDSSRLFIASQNTHAVEVLATYSITVAAGDNGNISQVDAGADAGSKAVFKIIPDNGYRISDVWVDGVSVGAVDSYSFDDLYADHTITADFVEVEIETFSLASIETGEVSVGHEWQRVELGKTFVKPVVVVKPASRNDISPAVVRVRNVDAQSFELRIQEWEYLLLDIEKNDTEDHAEEQVNYIVMEEGSYTLQDGTRIEAGRFETDVVSGFGEVKFALPFTVTPVVMSSIVTYNDDATVIGRMGNVNITDFGYMLQEQQINSQVHATETVSFIAWEPSQGSQDSVNYEVGAVNNAVTQQFTVLGFSGSYLNQPLMIADLQTANGGVVNLRWSDKSTTGASIFLDQELSSNMLTRIISGQEPPPPTPSIEELGYLVLSPASYTLIIEKSGLGSGSVQAQGIDCGDDCSEEYSTDALVTLSAVAAGDSVFMGWSGGGCSGTTDCVVTMNQATTVTATFELLAASSYTLTVAKEGTGSGSVQAQGIDCGNDCSENYNADAQITLSAVAADGSAFVGWSGGGCSGTTDCVVTMNQATTVTANFDIIPAVTYSITASADGNGSISPSGTLSYAAGTTVSFSITADVGYHILDVFVDGVSIGAKDSHSFQNLDANHTITATFAANVRVDSDCDGLLDEEEISKYGTDPQLADTDGDGLVDGEEVYYWLGNWDGDIDGDGVINLLDMDSAGNGLRDGSLMPVGDGTPTEVGDLCADTVSITASADGNGSISPSGVLSYAVGATVSFSITADVGYHISDVRVDGVSIGAKDSHSFQNLDKDHTIAVTFAADVAASDVLLLSSIQMGEVAVGNKWQRVELGKTFVKPVVVIKPASRNDVSPAVVRVRNVDATGFEVRIQEWKYLLDFEGNSVAHAKEQVGYVVMEKGSYTLENGARVEAGQFNTDEASVRFNQTFPVSPVVMSSVVTNNNADAPVIVQMSNIGGVGFNYKLQDEEALNNQIHEVETVSYIAWEPSRGTQDDVRFEVGTVNNAVPQEMTAIEFDKGYVRYVPPIFIADLQTTYGGVVNLRWSDKSTTDVDVLIDQEQSLQGSVAVSSSSEVIGYLLLSRADSDCDGLLDEEEINKYGTNPQLADTDGDGLVDGKEVYYWLGNWDGDIDGDGLINLLDMDSAGNGIRDGSLMPVGDGTPTEIPDLCVYPAAAAEQSSDSSSTVKDFSDRKSVKFERSSTTKFKRENVGFQRNEAGFKRNGAAFKREGIKFERPGAEFNN